MTPGSRETRSSKVELDDSSLDDFSLGSLSCDSLEDIPEEEDEDLQQEHQNGGDIHQQQNGGDIHQQQNGGDVYQKGVMSPSEKTGLERWQDSIQYLADVQLRNGRVPHVPVERHLQDDGRQPLNLARFIPQLTAACMLKETKGSLALRVSHGARK